MHRPIQPSSRLGWWALCLSFAAGVCVRVFPALAGLLGPQLGDRMPLDLAGAVIEVALAIAALVAGAVAMKRGERSWLNVVALVLALIIGMPWLSFALGKVLGPK